jgi:peptidoglycan/xylan/chitin deacetylase (PgdA/CDA1 family)
MLNNSIPVVMYHHVSTADRELNVYPEIFEDHLDVLSRKGWKTLSGGEFLYFLHNEREKPKKCVLLTFDDGFADNYIYAYPLLKKYNMKAMLFVATGFIEEREIKRDKFVSLSHNEARDMAFTERRPEVMCTWKELAEMDESGLFDIQSHGHSHKTPHYICEGRYDALREDLLEGKRTLEKLLSKKIYHFAWPSGCYDKESIKIAKTLGYRALYTIERGPNRLDDLPVLKRLPVKCRNGKWLCGKLSIYSSVLFSKLYLKIRTGI